MGVDMRMAREMGLAGENFPSTWAELIELAARWEETYAVEFPGASLFDAEYSADVKQTLFYLLLGEQTALINRGDADGYHTGALQGLMERLESLSFPENPLVDAGEGGLLSNWYRVMPYAHWWPVDMEPVLLAMEAGGRPIIPVYMMVYVVNPYSENQELAIAFLEACAKSMTAADCAGMMADWAEPVIDPSYEGEMAIVERTLAQQRTVLEEADESEKQAIQAVIDEMEDWGEYLTENRYQLSARDLEEYRQITSYLTVMERGYITGEGSDELSSLIGRCLDWQMSAAQLLEKLDEKLRMMAQEER